MSNKSPSFNNDVAMTEEDLTRQELLHLRECNKKQKKLLQRVLQEVLHTIKTLEFAYVFTHLSCMASVSLSVVWLRKSKLL